MLCEHHIYIFQVLNIFVLFRCTCQTSEQIPVPWTAEGHLVENPRHGEGWEVQLSRHTCSVIWKPTCSQALQLARTGACRETQVAAVEIDAQEEALGTLECSGLSGFEGESHLSAIQLP